MPYQIFDQEKWDSLTKAKWYEVKDVRDLGMYLLRKDYANISERQEALGKLIEVITKGIVGGHIFSIKNGFPEYTEYINDMNLDFKQAVNDLKTLLSYTLLRPEVEMIQRYKSAVHYLGGVTVYGVWTRRIFDNSLTAFWYTHDRGQQIMDLSHIKQLTDLVAQLKLQILQKEGTIIQKDKDISKMKSELSELQDQVYELTSNSLDQLDIKCSQIDSD
ncbi:hypothetical protein BDB01DRAFT_849602 [Pilobolus umbonatus]|nr:hypothetical protein BDB01DRAFT_849602 [Pilobolus umbonatus]